MLPGSSKSFFGGYVVYTSEAKAGFLGVQTSQPTSADTAIRLARALPRKDVRVSVVGNLGPSCEPGSPKGSVTVCLITEKAEKLLVKKLNHGRIRNRWISGYWVLNVLAREVQ
ncbi:hypothetical protein COPRO5265_01790 [Coprothermobacter proteolyticus DSM 5265]|nr:hypothetical protein COPRO5265_01790 [Coprothermobacter proteolyticus DSM 5265]